MRKLLATIADARGGALGMLQTMLAQVGITAVNVATGILTARLLGPAGRGEFAAAALWLLLPSMVAVAGLQSGVVYLSRRNPAQAPSILVAGLLTGGGAYLLAAFGSMMALPSLLHDYSPAVVTLARAAVLSAALNVGMLLARQSLLGTRQMHLFNLSSSGSPLAYLLLLLAVLPFYPLTPGFAVAAQVMASVLMLVPTLWWVTRGWHWRTLRPLVVLRPLAAYSVKAAGVDLVTVFAWNIDRLVLVGLISPAAFGLYTVATSLARLISVLQTALSSVTLADLANREAADIEAYVHRAVRMMFWTLAAACAGGWLAGGVLMRLVYGASFALAVPIFYVAMLESSVSCLSQVLVEAFLASGRPAYPSGVRAVYCVLLLAAMLLMAPVWGGMGAILALLLAMMVNLILLLAGLNSIQVGLPSLIPRRSDFDVFARLLRGSAPQIASGT